MAGIIRLNKQGRHLRVMGGALLSIVDGLVCFFTLGYVLTSFRLAFLLALETIGKDK